MKPVKQDAVLIRLRDFIQSDSPWGNDQGRLLFPKLQEVVEKNPTELVFSISLNGIQKTDVSFPREGVVQVAKFYRRSRGFCLVNVRNKDLIDNWDAAALKLSQPLTIWEGEKHQLIGPAPSEGVREMLNFVLSVPKTTTNEVATALEIKISNASNKLKKLWEDGFILRRERTAPTGGVEHEYFRIK